MSLQHTVAEKVELPIGVVSASVIILAVDDLRLLGMKRQSAFSEPPLKRCAQRPRLRLTAAVADRIIGIALERDGRMTPPHPHVERVMEKEIRQEGTDYSPYAKDNFCFERVIRGWRRGVSVVDLRHKR
jgi:hypothetical protein